MEVKGKVHCFFEQSGTFKNEFIKLGIPAEDYDIQNNFGETDHDIDLFAEIESAYDGKKSIFDDISQDDLIIAFFPCIYFESLSMMGFSWGCHNYKNLNDVEKTMKIIERAENRHKFYILLLKFVKVVMENNLRMIFENPYAMQHYLKQGNFVKNPDIIDNNRMLRGDCFIKPTAYWFFNCKPTSGYTFQNDKVKQRIVDLKPLIGGGICNESRSMIHPDYARNFICDFILGKKQEISQLTLF